MKTFSLLEIAVEVAWQLGDTDMMPRAESRWRIVEIAMSLENSGIITDTTEDIDEVINAYLIERGLK
jgi:hypothetical protein